MGQIIYREYIVFWGSNISCSLASAKLVVVVAFSSLARILGEYSTMHSPYALFLCVFRFVLFCFVFVVVYLFGLFFVCWFVCLFLSGD